MIEEVVIASVVLGVLVSLTDERWGFRICLVAGFLQEPLRKMMPGEPVYMTVLVGVFVAATMAGMVLRNVDLHVRTILASNPVLRDPLFLFIGLVIVQSVLALLNSGSIIIAGIGLLAYTAPLASLVLGYHLARISGDIRRNMKLYLAMCVAMMSGVYLSVMGYDWSILGAVGVGLHAYAPASLGGGILELHGGFFRGSELAGWHGATAVVLLIVLVMTSRHKSSAPWITGLLVTFLLGAILFTGRRKFLVEIFIFVSLYGAAFIYFRERKTRLVYSIAACASVVFVGYVFLSSADVFEEANPYYVRGMAVQEEALHRAQLAGLQTFGYIVQRNGFFGAGAGMGSQGSQYFGGGSSVVGSAAEGGLGKILAELGVPGLLLLAWLMLSTGRCLWTVVRDLRGRDPIRMRLALGLTAFLVANVAVFAISHQIFGDLFVLLTLGWMLGTILAIPRMEEASFSAR